MDDFTDISVVRNRLIEAGIADQNAHRTSDREAWASVNKPNQKLLKQILALHGWPAISLVGEEAERAAFLIAQHATNDLPLMETALSLRNALPEAETQRSHTALLEDRILMLKQQPQKYGSQMDPATWPRQVYPIAGIDMPKLLAGNRLQMELLNARRKTAGLNEPYDHYLAHFGIGVSEPTGRPLGG